MEEDLEPKGSPKSFVVKVFFMFRDETSDGACSCEIEDLSTEL